MNALKNLQPFIPEYMRDYYLSYKYSKQRKAWMKNGCPLPTPHIIKQLAIKSYKEKYNVDILIETGTYLGDMVYAQRKSFKRIYTIELSEKLYHYSKKRLNKYSNIKVIQGDSSIALDSIIKEINEPSIFWLDGHYSGGITAKGNSNCPILCELNAILSSKCEHIILIDDAREFNGSNDYPSIQIFDSVIREKGYFNSKISLEDDIIRIELKL